MCRNNVRSHSVKTTAMVRKLRESFMQWKHLSCVSGETSWQFWWHSLVSNPWTVQCPEICTSAQDNVYCSWLKALPVALPERAAKSRTKTITHSGSLNIFHGYPGFIYLLIDVISWIKHSFLDYLCYYKYNAGRKEKTCDLQPIYFWGCFLTPAGVFLKANKWPMLSPLI